MRRTTAVIIGAGHAGLAMSRCLDRALDRPCGPRARRGRQLVADRALGFAPAADAQLAEPAARPRLRGRRSRRLPHDARGRRASSSAMRGRSRRRSRPATTVTSVRRPMRGYRVATDRGDWHGRTLVLASGACNIPCVPKLAEAVPASITMLTPHRVPQSGPAADRRRAGGRRLGHGRPARRRDPALGPPGHARRAASTSASPRTYRGRDIQWWMDGAGISGPALRRGRRHRPRAPAALVPARRLARAGHARPQRADRASASSSSAALPASATAGCSSRARCTIIARWPT